MYILGGIHFDVGINARGIARYSRMDSLAHRVNYDFDDMGLKRVDIYCRTGVGIAKINPKSKVLLEVIRDIPFFDIDKSKMRKRKNEKGLFLLMGVSFFINNKKA